MARRAKLRAYAKHITFLVCMPMCLCVNVQTHTRGKAVLQVTSICKGPRTASIITIHTRTHTQGYHRDTMCMYLTPLRPRGQKSRCQSQPQERPSLRCRPKYTDAHTYARTHAQGDPTETKCYIPDPIAPTAPAKLPAAATGTAFSALLSADGTSFSSTSACSNRAVKSPMKIGCYVLKIESTC